MDPRLSIIINPYTSIPPLPHYSCRGSDINIDLFGQWVRLSNEIVYPWIHDNLDGYRSDILDGAAHGREPSYFDYLFPALIPLPPNPFQRTSLSPLSVSHLPINVYCHPNKFISSTFRSICPIPRAKIHFRKISGFWINFHVFGSYDQLLLLQKPGPVASGELQQLIYSLWGEKEMH